MIYGKNRVPHWAFVSLVLTLAVVLTSCRNDLKRDESSTLSSRVPSDSSSQSADTVSLTTSSGIKGAVPEKFAYVDGENRYGNAPYTLVQTKRRMVSDGVHIFWGLNELRCTDMDGKNPQILWENPVGQVSYYDGWIYFSDCKYTNGTIFQSSHLYRIGLDEQTPELVYQPQENSNNSFTRFFIANDRIYIEGYTNLKVMDISGQNVNSICDTQAWIVGMDADRVYYYAMQNHGLWSTGLDGSNQVKIFEDSSAVPSTRALECYVEQGWVYYFDPKDKSIYKMPIDGSGKQLLSSSIPGEPEEMFVVDDRLYYYYMNENEEKSTSFYFESVPISGENSKQLLCKDVMRGKYSQLEPIVIDRKIYYDKSTATGTYFCDINRIDLDGGNKAKDYYTKNL